MSASRYDAEVFCLIRALPVLTDAVEKGWDFFDSIDPDRTCNLAAGAGISRRACGKLSVVSVQSG